MTRQGPGRPQRWMVAHDRIRLIGLLRKAPPRRGFLFEGLGGGLGGSRAAGTSLCVGSRCTSTRGRTLLATSPTELAISIGLDYGRPFVGNVGSGEVKDFTAIGDVVNTAARLQSAAADGEIVLSSRLMEVAEARLPQARPTLDLKGKAEPEQAFVVKTVRQSVPDRA